MKGISTQTRRSPGDQARATDEVKPVILCSTPAASGLHLRLSFHFPEMMLVFINRLRL